MQMSSVKIVHIIEILKITFCKYYYTVITFIKYSLYPNLSFGKKIYLGDFLNVEI